MSIESPGVPPRVFDLLSPRSQQATNRILKHFSNNRLDLFSVKDDIQNLLKNSAVTKDSALVEECNLFLETLQKRFDNILDNKLSSNKYKNSDKGPFLVHVESRDKNIGNLNPISLGKLLYSRPNYSDFKISKICRKGLKRVGVYFDCPDNANNFVKNNNLDNIKYFVYIPSRMISTMGVVRDIGLDIAEDDLIEYGRGYQPDCKIMKMRRLNKRIKINDVISYVPTTTCVLTFESNNLPKELVLFDTLSPVSVYIQPVIQCLKCLRYGHVRALCRGAFRCHKCGESHPDEQACDGPPNCVFCIEPHVATDRSCKEYLRQKKIKECMAFYNMTYFEANKNSRGAPILTDADYPSLSQSSQNLTQNPFPSPFLNSQQSFSAVSKKNINPTPKSPPHIKKASATVHKRKVPTSPGYDSKAHESCLFTYKSLDSNIFSFSQPSQSSSMDLSPPKKMVTTAQIHHSAKLQTNSAENKNKITKSIPVTQEEDVSMEDSIDLSPLE